MRKKAMTDVLNNEAIVVLREAGNAHPRRLVKLIKDVIALLKLDLTGLTVLTEAASGPYVVTPLIAAMAGAHQVLAMTADSRYASATTVVAQTRMLERLCNLDGRVEISTRRRLDWFAQADIVTNLGFVRPIDAEAVGAMKPTAVVPSMAEAWETRPGDVDLQACGRKGIAVLATNEDYPGLEIFTYSGHLCLKMLFAAQIEVHQSKIIVVSSDKFGTTIARQLASAGAVVSLVPTLRRAVPKLAEADALVAADYCRFDTIVGDGGDLTTAELIRAAPALTVIQFAGRLDVAGLQAGGIVVYPGIELASHRMGMTLASLGPKPVVALHGAGLKVGEALARARQTNDMAAAIALALARSPGQRM